MKPLLRDAIEYLEKHCDIPKQEKSPVIGPPQWLIDRMEALKKLPPPTDEQVRLQWEASARWRKENITMCKYHPNYKPTNVPIRHVDGICHYCLEVFMIQNPKEYTKALQSGLLE